MANFLNEIIESTIQPVKTNVLWIKNGVPYYYNKRWKPLLGGASGGTVDSPITFGEGEYSAILNYSNNNALGSRSIALGYNTTSYNNYEASFGKYNKSVKSEDLTKATLFSVGNGNATFPKNALEIKWDGSVYISGIDKSVQDYLSSIKTYDSEINDILESIKGLSDRITITDSKLETKFEEFEEGINGELEEYYSKLTQTAKEIRAEVGSITTELDGRITENTALISITAKEIRSEVSEITTDLDGRIETNKSSISQTAEEIRAEVSRVQTDLSGRIDTANSTISQTADAIRLEVEAVEGELNGKIEKNTSLINQTAESIGLEVTNLSDHLNDVNSELAGLIAENKAAIEINANEIKNKVSSDTFNVFSGEVQNQFTEISTTVEGVKTSVQNLDGKLTEVNATVNGVTTRLGTAEADIESLKKQSDGSIDTHFGTEAPTLNNEPAVNWVTDDLKNEHTGDIYYNNNTGEAYRFSYNPETNEYFWIELTDSALTDALDKISKLESAVDGKVTIFYTTPTNYKYGDMWFVHEDNASFKKGTLVSATNLDKDTIRATLVLADWKEEIEYVNFDELTEELTSLNDYIDNAFKDGVLSEAEIKHIQELKKNFQLSYKEINDLNSFLIITAFATEENKTALSKAKKALDTAFNELIDAIDNLNTELDEDGNNPSLALYNAKYQAYLKALDDYTEIAVLIQSEAEQELLKPSDYIKQISSDGYLTPIEKKQLIAVWKQIAEEFTANRGIAFNYKILKKEGNNYIDRTDIYDVDTGYHTIYNNYKNSYEAIASIFTDEADPFGFKDLQNTTILSETTIESLASIEQLFDTYYANLALFSEMISKISNDITDAHQKVIDVTNALVDQLDPREAITQIGTGVVLSSVLGVKDINGNLEAVLNGSDSIEEAQSTKHGNHGKIVFAGGINGSSKWDNATTIIYEDGHVVINSGEISDFVSIGNATFKNVVEAVTQFDVISSPHVNPDTGEIEYIPLFQVNRNDAGEIIYVSSVYDFVGNREISALGFNAGGGSSGGGLISKVYNVNNFGNITDTTNTATFNAYAIDSLYKRIVSLENKEVDLTGYATESWVARQGFISSGALSPYMKTADANDTFATKTALNNLSSNHDSLAARVSTAEGNISTHTTQISGLTTRMGNAETNISTNAKGIADNKTAIATNKGNISANATAITNLGKRVTANEGNIAEILKWFAVDSDGNLYTTYNFYSTKEISANGLSIGSGSSGGGLISQVYGITAFGTIAAESNSATFNAYAIDSLYKRIVSLEGKATAVSFVPALTSGKQIGTLSIDGVSTVLYGVDAYSKTDADNIFLKLWGGTVTGNLNVLHKTSAIPLLVENKAQNYTAIAFRGANSNTAYLVYSGNGDEWAVTPPNWAGSRILLHSGNYSQYALPLSGGTVTGVVRIDTANSDIFFGIRQSGSDKSAFGWSITDGTYMYSYKSSRVLGIKDDGTPFFGTTSAHYTLLHSNNYSNYALPLTGGTISGNTYIPLKVVGTSVRTSIGFSKDASAFAYLTYNGGSSWTVTNEYYNNEYTLYHTGNFNPANYLPLTGGTISGSGDFAYVQLRIKGTSIPNIMFEVGSSEKGAIGWTANEGMRFTNAAASAYIGIKDNGTPHYNGNTLLHSGNYSNYALPLTGGTITYAGYTGLKLSSSDSSANYMWYEGIVNGSKVNLGALGMRGYNNPAYVSPTGFTYAILHENNFDDFALPLSGGTIGEGNANSFPLMISSTSSYTGISFKTSGGTAYMRYLGDSNWGVTDNGWNKSYTLIHSGNIGSQNAGSANMLKCIGQIGSSGFNANTDLAGGGFIRNYSSSSWWGSTMPSVLSYGVIYQLQGGSTATELAGQLAWDVNHRGADSTRSLWWRASDDTAFANAKWHQIAFTDSNVASATKLATARTIWGQSFDGTGNVDGDFTQSISDYGTSPTISHKVQGSIADRYCALRFRFNAYDHFARLDIESNKGVLATINSSGNVTIGDSDLAGTTYKLYVNGTVNIANALTVATNVQIPINGDRITFCSATGTYTKGILAMNTSNTYLEAPLATDSASGAKPAIMIGWRGCSAATGTTKPYPITITSGGIALNGAVTMSSTLHVVGVSTFESYLNIQAGIRPNANDARYVGTSSYRFNEGYINNMYTNAVYVGKGTTYGFKSDGSINATLINATNDIITSARLYAPHLFLGRNTEGIYLTSNGVSWHNSSNAWASSLMGFTSTSIIAHQSITANSGVKVASGQALTFLDASGKEHKLTYDSTAGAFKFDGNILVTGDGQFNAIN